MNVFCGDLAGTDLGEESDSLRPCHWLRPRGDGLSVSERLCRSKEEDTLVRSKSKAQKDRVSFKNEICE